MDKGLTETENIVYGLLHGKYCYQVALDISKSLTVLQYQTVYQADSYCANTLDLYFGGI